MSPAREAFNEKRQVIANSRGHWVGVLYFLVAFPFSVAETVL
jgi:hypothetical protein